MANSLEPDQDVGPDLEPDQDVGPDLDPNCLKF